MPRTYSLARLMLGVTLVCVLCGVIVSFPEFSLATAFFGCLFAPTAMVVYILARRSSRPVLFSMSTFGVATFLFVFNLLSALLEYGPFFDFLFFSIPPAVGTAIFGGLLLATEASPDRNGLEAPHSPSSCRPLKTEH